VGEAQLSTAAARVGAGGGGVGGAGVGGAGVDMGALPPPPPPPDVPEPPELALELDVAVVPDESSFPHPCVAPAIRKIPKNVPQTLIGESTCK
jgi:hypothetical protein